MNRRGFLGALLALPGLAKAQAAVTLDDYCLNGSYDLSAALRDGPVRLLGRRYECLPVRFQTGDMAEGVRGKTELLFETDGPAFMPADPTRFTDRFHFEGFDARCEAKAGPGQHCFYLPSCRHFKIIEHRGWDFGGTHIFGYGQRTEEGGLMPGDSTHARIFNVGSWRCHRGMVLTGTPGTPRIRGGTCNMWRVDSYIAQQSELDNIQVWQGAANLFTMPVVGQAGRDGILVAWYGNTFMSATVERNARFAVFKTNHAEEKNNSFPYLHDGGSNGGLCNTDLYS